MPWCNAQSVPFTRIDIVAGVPAESGVFAVMDGEACLLVGDTWNLKGRLLELANVLDGFENLRVAYELCSEESRVELNQQLTSLLMAAGSPSPLASRFPALGSRSSHQPRPH